MRVLVTGASSFVGLNVVEALCAEGCDVEAYVPTATKPSYLAAMAVRLHGGELTDRPRLLRLMRDVDAVINCATIAEPVSSGSGAAAVNTVDGEGTRAVLDSAIDAGVRRFVHTSSTASIGACNDPLRQWNEDTPLAGSRARDPFVRKNHEAESMVRAAILRGLDTIILNPAEMLGRWDHAVRRWGRMVLDVAAHRMPRIPPGIGSFAAASEVGRAHVVALTNGSVGSRYILAGTDAPYADLYLMISRVLGVTPAAISRSDAAPTNSDDGSYEARVLSAHRFDSSRAVRELGYRVVPLESMVQEAYAWYCTHGFVSAVPSTP